MKLKHVFTFCLVTVLIAAASCKKDDKEKPKTTAEKIQTKWSVLNIMVHADISGTDTSITQPASTSDYFDIRKDSLYVSLYPDSDTLAYALQNDSTMIIKDFVVDGDGTYKIRNLTDNTMSLYSRENDPSSADYIEFTFNLKK